jgi:hypothetical protein
MIEILEHRIGQALSHPALPRAPLYKEIVRSEICFLGVGPLNGKLASVKIWRRNDAIPVWADRDPRTGGFWIPVFCAPKDAAEYVFRSHLHPPSGQEFFWMSQKAQTAFVLLCHLNGFAGVCLYAGGPSGLTLGAPLVKEMAAGHIPTDSPPPLQ